MRKIFTSLYKLQFFFAKYLEIQNIFTIFATALRV